MTQPLLAALRARLVEDAGLAALLPAYRGASAVFTATPLPADAPLPAVVFAAASEDRPLPLQAFALRRLRLPVVCWAREAAARPDLDDLATRVRRLLEAPDLAFTGGRALALTVDGPAQQPAVAGLRARRLTVQLLLEEEQ